VSVWVSEWVSGTVEAEAHKDQDALLQSAHPVATGQVSE
jgi:hypothetical protein